MNFVLFCNIMSKDKCGKEIIDQGNNKKAAKLPFYIIGKFYFFVASTIPPEA